MQANYARALSLVLGYEGGWSNNSKDPGGATMRGIIQRVYDAYRRSKGVLLRSVRGIGNDEVAEIYKRQYADVIHFDDLPAGIDLATFDPAVNSGPPQATKWLQAAVGAQVDGHLGLATLAAVRAKQPETVINAICDARLGFMHRLRIWSTFGKGWGRRVYSVRQMALLLARQAAANDNRRPPLKAAA